MEETSTVFIRLENSPETARVIGELTAQQRLAYNQAVNILNREPDMPMRASKGGSYGLNKRITRWRNEKLSNDCRKAAPYHIHQQGSEAAWLANERLRENRAERQERVARAIEKGVEPHHKDVRPHRRTLKHRSRKHGTQTLTIRGKNFIKRNSNRSFKITGVDHVFHTRDKLPDKMLKLDFVELDDQRVSVNAPLESRRYALHVTVAIEVPDPPDLADAPLETYDGMDDGLARNWTFSNGEHYKFEEPYPKRDVRQERRTLQGKKKGSKRRTHHQRDCKERSRIRGAERKRQFNEHAIAHLDSVQPAAMALEQKRVSNMMRSAKGQGRSRKAGLNRELATAGLSLLSQILARQCAKRGIHTIPVPAPGSSQSCPNCGHRHRRNRESQAVFVCRKGDWEGNADHSAALIHRNRGFVRTAERIHGYTPCAEDVPTGWKEQPSRHSEQQKPAVAENASKPKRNAASPRVSAQRAGSGARGPTSQVPGKSGLPSRAGRPGKPGRRRRMNTIGKAVEQR